MANEFKVKKGLIIDGSGTVLDIQGTEGQLFSVTDSLTGDLFSVSDVSGIPILNVNSSGAVEIDGTFKVEETSTFKGDVEIHNEGNDTTGKLTLAGNNNTGTPGVKTSGTIEHRGADLKTVITHNGSDVITIGTGTQTTFAGDLMMLSGTSGTTSKIIFKRTDNASEATFIRTNAYWNEYGAHRNEGHKFIDSNSNILLQLNGDNSSSGNGALSATFAGNISLPGGWTLQNVSGGYAKFSNWVNVSNTGLYTTEDMYFDLDDSSSRFVVRGVSNAELFEIDTSDSNKATFAGNVNVPALVATADIYLNDGYSAANRYLHLRKNTANDGGIVMSSKTGSNSATNDWQIVNYGGNRDLIFYAYGLGASALTLDRENGNANFAGNVTVNGSLIGKSDHTTELGSYADGQIKRIRMSQGGEVVLGDSSTANPIGLTEGVWNSFGDSDYVSIYSRNSFRVFGYGTSATPQTHMFVGRHSSSGGSFLGVGNITAPNGTYGTSNTILTVKGTTSGGEGIVQIVGLGNNPTDNVGCLAFHSYAEADPMASIRSVRGSDNDKGSLAFNTNNGGTETTKMTILPTGEIGIGTTTPLDFDAESRNLVIRGGVNGTNPTIGITIAGDGNQAATGRGAIRFADGTSGTERYRGGIEYNHNGDVMSFRTSAVQRVSIGANNSTDGTMMVQAHDNSWNGGLYLKSENGNVTAKLHPENSGNYGLMLSSNFYVAGTVGLGTEPGSARLKTSGATQLTGGTLQVSTDSSLTSNYSYTFRDAVGINNPNSTSAATSSTTTMAIGGKSGGNLNTSLITTAAVGVATAAPASILHVHGTQSYGTIRVSPTSTNGESAMAFFLDTAGTTTGTAWVVGHAGWGNTGDFVIGNQTFGGPVMLIQTDGKTGIGTTAPGGMLHVRDTNTQLILETPNSSNDIDFRWRENGSNKWNIRYQNSGNHLQFLNQTGTALTQLSLNADGESVFGRNVTIDSDQSSGSVVLDVQGTEGQLFSITNSLSGDLFSVADVSGVPILNIDSSGEITLDGHIAYGNKLNFGTSGSGLEIYADSASNSYIKETGGSGALVFQSNHYYFQDNSNTTRFDLNAADGKATFAGKIATTSTGSATIAAIQLRPQVDGEGLGISAPSTDQMNFITADNTRMVIKSDGKVGMGVDNPWTNLVIAGSGSSTGIGTDPSYRLCLTNTNQTNNNWSMISFNDGATEGGSAAMGCQYLDHTNNYGSLVFATRNNTGFAERVRINSSGSVSFTQSIYIPDNKSAYFGTGSELRIFHDDGTTANSWIENTTGYLMLRSDTAIYLRSQTGNEPYINCFKNGGVELFFDDSKKFETLTDGAKVHGELYIDQKLTHTGDGNTNLNFESSQITISTSGGSHIQINNDENIYFRTNGTNRFKMDTSGNFTATADLIAFGTVSDKSFKENIKPINNALDLVNNLQGVTFDWKQDTDTNKIVGVKEDIGFIAQDVQKVLPELVRENDNGKLSLREKGIVPVLVEAIKELKSEIEELKKQIK